ncbi:MAG TPA: tetratricopeptide repeat protein [Patescibacteria group bacterium]|nr:tetratricopeptide repeat protein [Patescibacteria group bacterium]
MKVSKTKRDKSKGQLKGAQSQAASAPISTRRTWVFRLLTAIVLPLVLFGCLETGLRLGGFGYLTAFFLAKDIHGKRVLVENDKFGFRFFPPELARSPTPLVMEAEKPKNTCRIFILGESAALGDPEPAFGLGRYLQTLLRERFPQTRFEVICTAMTAINSHAILPIARECAARQGDIWVVYMGNNEFVGPFGPATVFGSQVPPLGAIHFNLAIKETRIGQLLSRVVSRRPEQKNWGGMKMFLDHQLSSSDPRRIKAYEYFKSNLNEIINAARGCGAKVVLSTVAVNLRDCPPFASANDNLPAEKKREWQDLYASAVRNQNAGEFSAALSKYEAAAKLDNSYAELQFRWAQCALASSKPELAKEHFKLARDFDTLPFRADDRLNSIIRGAARENTTGTVRLVDPDVTLGRDVPASVPGNESFFEHVHLNFEGNYRLAREVCEAVTEFLPESIKKGGQQSWADLETCARRLGLTEWDKRRVYETLFHRMAEPPFLNQTGHAVRMEDLREALVNFRSKLTPDALERARAIYQAALTASPEDLYLHADFAKLNEDTGDLPSAVVQWTLLRDEIPFAPGPHYYLGKALGAEGKNKEALEELEQALSIRPDLPEALEEKGRLLVRANRLNEGLAVLDQASELEPRNARICMSRAQALAAMGHRGQAIRDLRRAVELQPGYWEAHYLLGVEFAFEGAIEPAAEQFQQTIRLNPNYPLAHLNLGIALAKLHKLEEAISEFQETLRLDPKNQKASQYLAALQSQRERNVHTDQVTPQNATTR